jgi:outer membrane murein-binding lipoprotein Lpp
MSEDIQAIKKISNQIINKISGILEREKILFEQNESQEELLELVSQKLASIENNFEELTKSLAQGSYPVKLANTIAITESLVIPKINAIEISTSQLVETYNEAVNLLSGYAIKVFLTAESYREPNSSEIILETGERGNYWVIATIEQEQQKYWLVPNGKITLNVHKLKTIQTLFQLEGEHSSSEAEFYLQQLAILSLLPNGRQWRLEEQGILVFGKYSKSSETISDRSSIEINNQISSTVEKLLSNQQTLITTVERSNTKVTQLESQLNKVQQDRHQEKQDWLSEKQNLQEQFQQSKSHAQNIFDSQFGIIYDYNKTSILEKAIATVSIRKKSWDDFKNGNNNQIKFKVEKLLSNQQNLISTVEQLNNKVSQLQSELDKVQQDHDREKKDWFTQTQELQNKLQEVVRSPKQKVNSFVGQTVQESTQKISSLLQPIVKQNDSKIQLFVIAYNQDKKFILKRIVSKVTISLENFENIIFGNRAYNVTLNEAVDGNYWIIDYLGVFYLVPKEDLKIERDKLNVLLALFAFDPVKDYKDNANFQLIQPAKVSQLSSEQWKLEERGLLKFL